jgi:hypothetical protein
VLTKLVATDTSCGWALGPGEVDAAWKVAFLASPLVYADTTPRVEIIETHFSLGVSHRSIRLQTEKTFAG